MAQLEEKRLELQGDARVTASGDSATAEPEHITYSDSEWESLFTQSKFDELSEEFLRVLKFFLKHPIGTLEPATRLFLDKFIGSFMRYFCDPRFTLPANATPAFLMFQPLIANLVAISDYQTTTPWVVQLAQQKGSFYKLLAIHNVRNNIDLDEKLLFDTDRFYASHWWAYFWLTAPAYCTPQNYASIRRHLHSLDPRFVIFGPNARITYFPVTYVDAESDGIIKERLNKLSAEAFSNVKITCNPNPRKIALVSGRWVRSAVYSSIAPLVHSLQGHYDLSMIDFGNKEHEILDTPVFQRIYKVKMDKMQMDLSELQNHEFTMLLYPDIGMNAESIYLSNIRVAPIQATMYGHPTSTRGAKIDYFIGGREVEDLSRAEVNYSERLVVIPGLGVYPVIPEAAAPVAARRESPEKVIINCAWTAQKANFPLLNALRKAAVRSRRHIVFRFFPGFAVMPENSFIPYTRDVCSVVGEQHVLVQRCLPDREYRKVLHEGSFSIDSHPFGGFNTVMDSFTNGKPIVTWRGTTAAGRIASATLEMLGLGELVAEDEEEYIELIVKLANDDDYRYAMTEAVCSLDLAKCFAERIKPEYFRTAIDFIIANHDKLSKESSRAPIVIPD